MTTEATTPGNVRLNDGLGRIAGCLRAKCGEYNMLRCTREGNHVGDCCFVVDHENDYWHNRFPNVTLPVGWTEERDHGIRHALVLRHKAHGWVTIDLKERIFSPGMGTPRSWRPSMAYSGAGWKQRLLNDATAHIDDLWTAA